MTGRPGVTLPELIVTSWLFALVLLGLARFATAQGRLAAETHDRLRASDLARTVELVLGAELEGLAPPDARIGRDSIRVRAVRGSGVICAVDGEAAIVRYEGLRRPDPAKDSALVLTHDRAGGRAHALLNAYADDRPGCATGLRLVLDPEPPPAGLVLVFETGSYHLAGGALRYRRGRAGRQPVTEGILITGAFDPGPGRLDALLGLHPDSVPRLGSAALRPVIRLATGAGDTLARPTAP